MAAKQHSGKKATGGSKGAAAPSPTNEAAPRGKRRQAPPKNSAAVSKPPLKGLAATGPRPDHVAVQAIAAPASAEQVPVAPLRVLVANATGAAGMSGAVTPFPFPEWPRIWSGFWSVAPLSVTQKACAEASQACQQVQESVAETASATAATWLELQGKIWGLALAQREAGLSMLGSLMGARSMSDAVELQARHAGRAFGAASARLRDLSDTAQRLIGTAIPPDKKAD